MLPHHERPNVAPNYIADVAPKQPVENSQFMRRMASRHRPVLRDLLVQIIAAVVAALIVALILI